MFLNLLGNIFAFEDHILFPQQCFLGWANMETLPCRKRTVSATMYPVVSKHRNIDRKRNVSYFAQGFTLNRDAGKERGVEEPSPFVFPIVEVCKSESVRGCFADKLDQINSISNKNIKR